MGGGCCFLIRAKEVRDIAIYHLSIKIISRGKGRSAVAAAAYRSGGKIENEYDGIIHDYTHKGGIAHTKILLPENAPPEYVDRAMLWNSVEKIEKAKNAQLAREIELALPIELTLEQNTELVRAYCQKHFVNAGMCADICIHDKGDRNPHAHVMLTMRPFNEDGTWGGKQKKDYILNESGKKIYDPVKRQYQCKSIPSTDWNEQTKAEEWRAGWTDAVNAALEQQSVPERIDHRSYERQGIEQIPTIHMGAAASQLEKRGIVTERGDINRKIISMNQELRQLRARIGKLQKWLDEEVKTETIMQKSHPIPSENLISILSNMLGTNEGKKRWQKIADLKSTASALAFLHENDITALPKLKEKVNAIRGELIDVREKLKPIEQRLKTLDEHIHQAEIYGQYKNRKRSDSEEILFVAAKKYLSAHLNGRNKIPLAAWKTEYKNCIDKKECLYQSYHRLKDETHSAELLKKAVEHAVRECNKNISTAKMQLKAEL